MDCFFQSAQSQDQIVSDELKKIIGPIVVLNRLEKWSAPVFKHVKK